MGGHETVIEIEGLGKRYLLGEHHGGGIDLRRRVRAARGRVRGEAAAAPRDIWSLRDISFSVGAGESLGVVGANGAGKSTLLKTLSGITTPTEGVVRTRGRVGSLLEVGTGFHPELTGLENAYLNGAILGMSRREIDARLDDIVEFAGIGDFMDTPVKRYSSGMYLRLGFAVAAHIEADILLVDEVLAVGDAEFQRRCLAKMSEVESDGRTVVFVSHNLEAITQLCSHAIWLQKGRLVEQGPSAQVIENYLATTTTATDGERFGDLDTDAQLRSVRTVDRDGRTVDGTTAGGDLWIEFEVEVRRRQPTMNLCFVISNALGVDLMDMCTGVGAFDGALREVGTHRVRAKVPSVLAPGRFGVSVWLGTDQDDFDQRSQAASFVVEGTPRPHSWFITETSWEHDVG